MKKWWLTEVQSDLNKLCQKLAYTFTDVDLLKAALTHRSVRADNNERLEFLGDAIVNFIIAEALFQQFPHVQEGALSRMRANLVNGETLAELAHELALNEFVRLGPGELKSGGHQRASILANAMEAVIAAIYRDSDMATCREHVLKWYASRLAEVEADKVKKDAKTCLQEYLQARKLNLPQYTVIEVAGEAHQQIFTVSCAVPDSRLPNTQGQGSSRRRAEQEAAKALLIACGQAYE